ncbi:glycine-rich protein [Prunus dulcis]|uniref:Glycine-rich protein n=1 Tax=Prunus dulcis TaxID=3755 RepID=A0A4Y1QTI5_PRUDU|nr:glycine-rich protein [Prunus dulcis]
MGFRRHTVEFLGSWCRWRLWGWSRSWMGIWHRLW